MGIAGAVIYYTSVWLTHHHTLFDGVGEYSLKLYPPTFTCWNLLTLLLSPKSLPC